MMILRDRLGAAKVKKINIAHSAIYSIKAKVAEKYRSLSKARREKTFSVLVSASFTKILAQTEET